MINDKEYRIIITYTGGKQEFEKTENGILIGNYTEIKQYYLDNKNKYKNNANIMLIEVCGYKNNKRVTTPFTAEFNNENDKDIIYMLDKDPRELIKEANKILRALKQQPQYLSNKRDICEKKRDTLLKALLLSDNEEDKIKREQLEREVTKKIKRNEQERKRIKNYYYDCSDINRDIDLMAINNQFSNWLNPRNLKGCDKEKPQDYKKRVEKEITYKNKADKDKKIKKYRNHYDEYRVDLSKNIIFFYNHVGEGKRKRYIKK